MIWKRESGEGEKMLNRASEREERGRERERGREIHVRDDISIKIEISVAEIDVLIATNPALNVSNLKVKGVGRKLEMHRFKVESGRERERMRSIPCQRSS